MKLKTLSWFGLFALLSLACIRVDAAAVTAAKKKSIVGHLRYRFSIPESVEVRLENFQPAQIKGFQQFDFVTSQGGQERRGLFLLREDGNSLIARNFKIFDITKDPTLAASEESKKIWSQISLKDQHVRGPENARVTIVEYSDFQ